MSGFSFAVGKKKTPFQVPECTNVRAVVGHLYHVKLGVVTETQGAGGGEKARKD